MPEITDEQLAAFQAQATRAAQADELAAEVERLTPLANELEAARNETTQATEAARAAIVTANPLIPPELITGATIGEINESLAAAQAIANSLARAAKNTPAYTMGFFTGGNQRPPIDTSAMTAHQKIAYGVQHEREQHRP